MKSNPLVSVIVPVYNGAAFLKDALDSIRAQTYRPLEIIVIDDGSTDASADVARSFQDVRYAPQTHAGLAAALNHGIELATGDYFAFLDADDVWVASKLTKQMECFDEQAALEIVFSYLQPFYDDDPSRVLESMKGYFKGTMVVRREAFFRVGWFDPQWRVGDFVDWYVRAREKNIRSQMLDEVLLRRRIHQDNMSTRERAHHKAYVHILKQSLDRRQKQNL